MVMNDDKNLERFAWVVIVCSILYFGGHFLFALAYGWDGMNSSSSSAPAATGRMMDNYPSLDYGESIELNTGTRVTVEDSGVLLPGGEVQITDSHGNIHDMEIITINPITGGPVQMEVYDAETGTYHDLEMNLQ